MKHRNIFFALSSLLILAASAALAADPGDMAANLPRSYKGVFRWNDRKFDQQVVVRFDSVAVDSGKIRALGSASHEEEYYRTDVRVEMLIDPETRAFEMWERAPSGKDTNPKFVVDGSYLGEISGNLAKVKAVWTTSGSGRKGVLRLTAD